MQTLHIRISDRDAQAYNLRTEQEISFPDLVESISRVYAKQALLECNAIAEKNGLSTMSLDDINAEIRAVRHAKNHS
jgi:DeoR/GlpR family transcriptional regulator of sugar metabolism